MLLHCGDESYGTWVRGSRHGCALFILQNRASGSQHTNGARNSIYLYNGVRRFSGWAYRLPGFGRHGNCFFFSTFLFSLFLSFVDNYTTIP